MQDMHNHLMGNTTRNEEQECPFDGYLEDVAGVDNDGLPSLNWVDYEIPLHREPWGLP